MQKYGVRLLTMDARIEKSHHEKMGIIKHFVHINAYNFAPNEQYIPVKKRVDAQNCIIEEGDSL